MNKKLYLKKILLCKVRQWIDFIRSARYHACMELKGKTVLITGAARRIGREISVHLAKRGARILAHYRKSKKEILSLQREISEWGGEMIPLAADFSASGSLTSKIRQFVKLIYREVPQVDVLVNNASIFYPTPFGKITEKDWDAFLATNLKAPFFLSQEIGLRMIKRGSGGKIINLVDWTGERPSPHFLPYCISKAGLIAATKGLAKALAPQIQVSGIAPGPILPAQHASLKEQKLAADKSLLKRYGHPRDIAQAVRFLIEGSDFTTGSILYVDGGASLA